ncbi:MAG: hypothetical protein JNN07_10420 [Verrucomicrobiales bacterium]|nr:hypothetical protein [Verrucomicrobiales bacterium]
MSERDSNCMDWASGGGGDEWVGVPKVSSTSRVSSYTYSMRRASPTKVGTPCAEGAFPCTEFRLQAEAATNG